MINLAIQILTLLSGLLVNFLIPLLFGLEEYGLFIKANILVFLFHKLTDVISEPLISNSDKQRLLPIAALTGLFIIGLFLVVNIFFSAGSPWLLGSMVWSSCVLLTFYSQHLQRWIIGYLLVFIAVFVSLLFSAYYHFSALSITEVMEITNFVPPTVFLLILLYLGKIELTFNEMTYSVIKMLRLMPRLFSLTLVNNLFTNILPFYLSFIFPPQLLGLYRVQVSVVQSVVAVFPINTKVISNYFVNALPESNALEPVLKISLNYFLMIALSAYIAIGYYQNQTAFAQVFFLLPVVHAAAILERYLLGVKLNRVLIVINLAIAILSCLAILLVTSLEQMMLLYACAISLYLFMMLMAIKPFKFRPIIQYIAIATPCSVYYGVNSAVLGTASLCLSFLVVVFFIPMNKNTLAFLRR